MKPVIITAAIVGAETMREHNPNVPYTPEEIADEAKRCVDSGASIIHVHGRNADGSPTQKRETFRAIRDGILERCDCIVQFSTGGAVGMSVEERTEALDLSPEMATLTTGTVNFGDDVFLNSYPMIVQIAERLRKYNVTPEIEIFDTGMVDTALRLLKDEVLSGPLHFDFVLGVPGGMGGRTENLDFVRAMIPDDSTWSVAGVGRYEMPLAEHAINTGGHVRVGLEDNIFITKGVLAAGSFELVEKVAELAASAGRPVATVAQTREMLGL